MPMIEFRYSDKISEDDAYQVGSGLEAALRQSIEEVLPRGAPYNITVEGDPFGVIAFNQPDLRIYIFYHPEWNFTPEDLVHLTEAMGRETEKILQKIPMLLRRITVKIRFYLRPGHAATSIP